MGPLKTIEESNENKYLTLVSSDESKDTEKTTKNYGIRNQKSETLDQ